MIPRIMGRVGCADEPAEMKGKFFFEMFLTYLGSNDEPLSLGQYGPFETEEIAKANLMEGCRLVCEKAEKAMGEEPTGKYINLKTNRTEKWEKQNETI